MQIYKYFPKLQNFIPKRAYKRGAIDFVLRLPTLIIRVHFYLTMQWLKGVSIGSYNLLLNNNIPVEEVGSTLLLQRC